MYISNLLSRLESVFYSFNLCVIQSDSSVGMFPLSSAMNCLSYHFTKSLNKIVALYHVILSTVLAVLKKLCFIGSIGQFLYLVDIRQFVGVLSLHQINVLYLVDIRQFVGVLSVLNRLTSRYQTLFFVCC